MVKGEGGAGVVNGEGGACDIKGQAKDDDVESAMKDGVEGEGGAFFHVDGEYGSADVYGAMIC